MHIFRYKFFNDKSIRQKQILHLRGLICSSLASYIDRIFNVSLAAACLRAWGYEVNQKESGDSLGLWLVRVRAVHFGGSSCWINVLVRIQKSLDYLHG